MMFALISKSKPSPFSRVYIRLFSRSFSSSVSNSVSDGQSFTASYLINSCGFPPERAQTVSKYVKFRNPERANSVLSFFKNYGFTETQVSVLVRRFPLVLQFNAEKNILPKLEFLHSRGIFGDDLVKCVTGSPKFLGRSLENHIIPAFDLIRGVFQSDEKTLYAIKRYPTLLSLDFKTCIEPNIQVLQDAGVPGSNILFLLSTQPRDFMASTECFKSVVEEVKEMGFNPLKVKFVLAVHTLRSMSKSTWAKKVEIYKKWGWSEDEILAAFRQDPWCMVKSEEKIDKCMDFFLNKMGCKASVIAKSSIFLSLSFEKRIVPRCFLYQHLLENGLLKVRKNFGFTRWLKCSEDIFVGSIRKKYEKEAEELLKLYQAQLDLAH